MKKITFDRVPEALESLLNMTSQLLEAAQMQSANQPQPNLKEILTVVEATELLGVNRTTIHRWEKKGLVKSYAIEGRRYYKRTELLNALHPLN